MLVNNSKTNVIQTSSVFTVNLHLTNRCNFACKFCYANFEESKNLSFVEWEEILTNLAEYGIRKINFAGGEPFLYKGFEILLVKAKELGFKTSIISNGSLIK